jgi:starvation-inducible DNA-binding protein
MDELIEQMKLCLASVFSLYLKTHYFHWNVEGKDFSQFHEFFGELYEEIYGSIDPMAEEIRTLGSYAPGSLARFKDLSKIEDETNVPDAIRMVRILQMDNQIVITELKKARKMADEQDAHGLVNFLEDRLDKHWKHDWQLKATLK